MILINYNYFCLREKWNIFEFQCRQFVYNIFAKHMFSWCIFIKLYYSYCTIDMLLSVIRSCNYFDLFFSCYIYFLLVFSSFLMWKRTYYPSWVSSEIFLSVFQSILNLYAHFKDGIISDDLPASMVS